MESNYDFDVPQFLDLRDRKMGSDDLFFDRKMMKAETEDFKTCSEDRRRVIFAPDEKENDAGDKYSLGHRIQTPIASKSHHKEKSNSIDADALLEKIESLHIDSSKKTFTTPLRKPLRATQVFEGIPLIPTSEKKHKMVTRADSLIRTPLLQLRSRSIPKPVESEDETEDSMLSAISSTTELTYPENKPDYYIKRNISYMSEDFKVEPQPKKFVALAEQIAKFHKETPDRFRTKPHQKWRPSIFQPRIVMAQGPKLSCASRSRPSYFPNQLQREQQEYDEMMKLQIKARPVNRKILTQVSLGLKAPIEKRQATLPEPFHLTKYNKPKAVESEPVFKFKAQPAPTRILQSPSGIPPRKVIPPTTPRTPAITLPVRVKVPTPRPRLNSATSTDSLPRNTKVEPFSFEQRDRLLQARKVENVQRIIAEERKSFNSFKAQPIRKFSEKHATPMSARIKLRKTTTPMPFNLTKSRPLAEKMEPEIPSSLFKAKPASVLVKQPFYPVHAGPSHIKMSEFQFKTCSRAEERKKFDAKLQQAEEETLKAVDMAREDEEKKLQEEIKELRKQAEFKANSIPRGRVFQIHASNTKLTTPVSPQFRSGKPAKKPSAE